MLSWYCNRSQLLLLYYKRFYKTKLCQVVSGDKWLHENKIQLVCYSTFTKPLPSSCKKIFFRNKLKRIPYIAIPYIARDWHNNDKIISYLLAHELSELTWASFGLLLLCSWKSSLFSSTDSLLSFKLAKCFSNLWTISFSVSRWLNSLCSIDVYDLENKNIEQYSNAGLIFSKSSFFITDWHQNAVNMPFNWEENSCSIPQN